MERKRDQKKRRRKRSTKFSLETLIYIGYPTLILKYTKNLTRIHINILVDTTVDIKWLVIYSKDLKTVVVQSAISDCKCDNCRFVSNLGQRFIFIFESGKRFRFLWLFI